MTDVLQQSALNHWQTQPIRFIEEVLLDPESNQPFELFAQQREFFKQAWQTNADGRLTYPEQCFSGPKKVGKSATAAMHLLVTTLVFGGRFAEGYAIANDLEQAQGRVFLAVRRVVEASPLLRREAEVTQSRISFPETGAVIQAIGQDYASAAGANPTVSSFDELWGYTSERSRRLWDEMVPSPARKISARLVTTYAGFEGESHLLEELYKRGLTQPQIGNDLHAGNGLLMFWSHSPIAPWQSSEWIEEMRRSLRANQFLRMIENRFVTTESSFVDLRQWDRCVDQTIAPARDDRSLNVFVGVDASVRHDSTAIVAVTFDDKLQQLRLVFHRVFQPTPDQPLDFEATIEQTLLDLSCRFRLCKVLFDPYQMQATAQRLLRAGLPVEEFPQSSPNLTSASQNLFDHIQSQSLTVYPDAALRLAVSRAVAVETPRGWRISKQTASHKIDVVVALAMACRAAIDAQSDPAGLAFYDPFYGEPPPSPNHDPNRTQQRRNDDFQTARLRGHLIQTAGMPWWMH